jgi:hypothetical protein
VRCQRAPRRAMRCCRWCCPDAVCCSQPAACVLPAPSAQRAHARLAPGAHSCCANPAATCQAAPHHSRHPQTACTQHTVLLEYTRVCPARRTTQRHELHSSSLWFDINS